MDSEGELMRRGPKLEPIILTTDESNRLVEWTRRHKTSQALAMRARVILNCKPGRSNREIAEQLRVTAQTVGKWRTRFSEKRLDGLLDEPRPGAPRTIGDAAVEQVIAKTLHEKPRAATHWSSRSMAKASGLSQSAVVRIWHAFGLQLRHPDRHLHRLRRQAQGARQHRGARADCKDSGASGEERTGSESIRAATGRPRTANASAADLTALKPGSKIACSPSNRRWGSQGSCRNQP
jgi:transposase